MQRRYFLMGSAAAVATRASARTSANDTVRIACVGVRSQGRTHLEAYGGMHNVEVAAICDVDESILSQRLRDVENMKKRRPAGYTDLRKLLEDKSIDAISIATPNHNHALQTIWSCQAGKDVYVEKPCAHNIFEAKQLVAVAKRYDRMVQHGTHSRSLPVLREAAQLVRDGAIGDVYHSRALCYKWRNTIGHTPVERIPAGVHYDLWLGPASKREFTRNRFHYNFHWFWEYGNGEIGNQGIHQMDVARWLLGVKYPTKISAMGGHYMFNDDQETPNTIVATFEFDEGGRKKLLVFDARHWITNGEAGVSNDPNGVLAGVGNIVYGSKGYLTTGSNGFKIFLGKEQQPGPVPKSVPVQNLVAFPSLHQPGPQPSAWQGMDNHANFIQAVRSRKCSDLNAPMEEALPSVALVHLANISYRLGRTLYFDSATLTCKGDAEANRMFTRDYRAPFVVPDKV